MTKEEIIRKLIEVKGIGPAKAETIYNEGFDSIEKLANASIEELMKIKGINEAVAREIIKYFTAFHPEKTKEAEEIAEKSKERSEKVERETRKTATPIEYKVKKKPVLSDEMRRVLSLRKRIKERTPRFLREEWFRYKRIPMNWRKPDGITSKMRRNFKYRPKRVKVGFRGPKKSRVLHPSGFEEVLVYNVKDLEGLDPKTQAARIGSTVGTRKRMEIHKKAEELDIRILNG